MFISIRTPWLAAGLVDDNKSLFKKNCTFKNRPKSLLVLFLQVKLNFEKTYKTSKSSKTSVHEKLLITYDGEGGS